MSARAGASRWVAPVCRSAQASTVAVGVAEGMAVGVLVGSGVFVGVGVTVAVGTAVDVGVICATALAATVSGWLSSHAEAATPHSNKHARNQAQQDR